MLTVNAGPYTLTKTWAVDGTATDVGTVTIGITDANGATVVAAGTATSNGGDGTYTYTLANQTAVKLLTVTWTRSDTSASISDLAEITGGRLFTEIQARAFSAKADGTAPLSSATEYTDAMIADQHDRIAGKLEAWTYRSWIPRYCRVELSGTGSRVIDLTDGAAVDSSGNALYRPGRQMDIAKLLSVTVDGSTVATSNFVIDGTLLRHTSGTFTRSTVSNPLNVVVKYHYGLSQLVDGVDRVALLLALKELRPSAIPDSALSWSSDLGTMQIVQPGGPQGNVSSIAEVNQWVREHDLRVPIL